MHLYSKDGSYRSFRLKPAKSATEQSPAEEAKEDTATTPASIYAISAAGQGVYVVANRLTGDVHEVKVNHGRYAGPCSCGAALRPPFEKCEHQVAVRRHLMDRAWKGSEAARRK